VSSVSLFITLLNWIKDRQMSRIKIVASIRSPKQHACHPTLLRTGSVGVIHT
jgi:hypothetical protein